MLHDEIGPSSDIKALLRSYFTAKLSEEKAKREKETYRARLVEQLGRKIGKLTQEEFARFEATTDQVIGVADVTVFAKEVTSWNSQVLEEILTKTQVKKATKKSWHSEARITSKG